MKKWYNNRIDSAVNGTNPMVMKEMTGGYAVLGDVQFLPGYSVLLSKRNLSSLNELNIKERTLFLRDMSVLGDAILATCQPERTNYDILGNTNNFLHAHVFPRYLTETSERLKKPVWLYDSSYWSNPKYRYDPKLHDNIRNKITSYLNKIII